MLHTIIQCATVKGVGGVKALRGNWECSKHVEEIPKYQRTAHRSGVAVMFPFDKKQAAKKIGRDTERERG